ncbi:MAG TPA: tyrosine--tRNA ligase [Candidatus Paceibacterota bacterium]|nr:tyrosine--tRNA ligase [Candidatus Paceibacterota bacterium]
MGLFSRTRVRPGESAPTDKLSHTLRERGYVYQHTATLEEITDGPKRTLYLGIDPTADSMHVGHLQAMLVLRRFLEHGHRVIVLLGGGTGMIGDPSGKSEERVLLDAGMLARNAAGIKRQAERLFNSDNFEIRNNLDWLGQLKVIDFLRDIGKHFSVNAMMARDSVKERLENREQGISYTEFSYMLLQSYDFLHLFESDRCTLQLGASDQWGNMVSGADLIRRKTGGEAYALSFPLLINKSTGKKFGKSEGGAVWLDPKKTPPFQFYQFWINVEDANVEEYLLKMTLLSKEEIGVVMAEQNNNPASRAGQKRLAYEITALVHGVRKAEEVKQESKELFTGGSPVQTDNIPTMPAGTLRQAAGILEISISELRRLIEQGAVSSATSGNKFDSIDADVSNDTIKIGKNRFIRVE